MVTLKNYMEEIVLNLMEGVLDDINMCKCELCVKDIAALALNDLPPKYIVSEKGELYIRPVPDISSRMGPVARFASSSQNGISKSIRT
jgi:hypothetical protein